ncbi:hypothetical protein ON010_g2660 [Phytophthora cinnamomi]|nr:hypothetical protein ON010_g2660 [Phytophthora cinnamomi]
MQTIPRRRGPPYCQVRPCLGAARRSLELLKLGQHPADVCRKRSRVATRSRGDTVQAQLGKMGRQREPLSSPRHGNWSGRSERNTTSYYADTNDCADKFVRAPEDHGSNVGGVPSHSFSRQRLEQSRQQRASFSPTKTWEGRSGTREIVSTTGTTPRLNIRSESQPTTSPDLKRQRLTSSSLDQLTNYAKKMNEKYTELLAVNEKKRRQERCDSQRRYRKKQDDRVINLKNETVALQQEIKDLERHHSDITIAAQPGFKVGNVANDMFELFSHVFYLKSHLTSNQLDFLRVMVAPDVASTAGFGLEAMVKSWSFIQWFDKVEIEFGDRLNRRADFLFKTTRISVTITERTLRHVFPNLQNPQDNSITRRVLDKLLHQRIVLNGALSFKWDNVSSQVTSVVAQSDMIPPMVKLLGNLEDVSRVFTNALISPEFRLRSHETPLHEPSS